MNKSQSKKLRKQYALPKWFWTIVIALGTLSVIAIAWLIAWQSGWPGYVHALNECGGKPPVQASKGSVFTTYTYLLPADDEYRIPGQRGFSTYYCTEAEARREGLKHEANQ